VLSTVFALGFLATRAEPALRVMGKTVETLSEGTFSQVLRPLQCWCSVGAVLVQCWCSVVAVLLQCAAVWCSASQVLQWETQSWARLLEF